MYMDMTTYTIMGQYGLQTQKVKTKTKQNNTKPTTKQETKGKAVKGILELGWERRQAEKKEKAAPQGKLRGCGNKEILKQATPTENRNLTKLTQGRFP